MAPAARPFPASATVIRSIIDAIKKQVETLPYAHTSFFTTDVMEELAEILTAQAPGMDRVLLLSGGSETIEAALKLSRQYFVETGETDRHLFIARRQSYHGNTLGALAVGGNEWRRRNFAPLMVPGNHISPCFEYRDRRPDESAEAYGLRVADELEEKIQQLGPEKVAAFVAETVVGATAGAVAAVPGYFKRIRQICDRYGVHLILDEVMCGAGRTGTFTAYEQEGIVPDMVTVAKGLAAGYQPTGALLCREQIIDAIRAGSGFFQHGHTFMGHATAVAAALATQQVIRNENLMQNVVARGDSIRTRLHDAFRDHPHVGDVRGRGLFIGVEFVSDRDSKAAFEPDRKIHNQVQKAAFEAGLMCYGMGGTIDGRHGDHILLAPPYNLSEAEETELVDKFTKAAAVRDALTSIDPVRQPGNQLGKYGEQQQREQLNADERHSAAIDLRRGYRGRRHAAQIEQCETERRRQERGLQVDRDHDAQPDGIETHREQHRPDDRHDNERDLYEVEHEAEQEHHEHDDDDRADNAAGQRLENGAHTIIAAVAAKHEREYRGADQDQEDHAADAQRALHDFLQTRERQLATGQRKQQRAHAADAGSLGRRRKSFENGAEHRKYQDQRRQQCAQYPT